MLADRFKRVGKNVGIRAKLAGRLATPRPSLGFDEVPMATAIRMAYNTVLRREPDDDIIRDYESRIRNGTLTRQGLLDELAKGHGVDGITRPPVDRIDFEDRLAPTAIWPTFPPPHYLGQLEDSFQQTLARERSGIRTDDFISYHTIDLPGGETIHGPWDLRGGEPEYLGHVDLKGKRVLEFGPASGYLSFWMESQGADVVGIDCGYDCRIDLMPKPGEDLRRLYHEVAELHSRYHIMWWYCHDRLNSKAKIAYGDVYNLPGDFGEFDISTFSAILLHLRSPIDALTEGAKRTKEAIIVTDTWDGTDEELMQNIMRPFPLGEAGRWSNWWHVSAGAVVQMLEVLGFGNTTVIQHTQKHMQGHDPAAGYTDMPMYTVVGRRS